MLFQEVEPVFPPIALREALVNAFCHRDYAQAGGAVSVAIYDDRLEIWSSGGLPPGVEVEDLNVIIGLGPRNPLIAELFYRRRLRVCDRAGRGGTGGEFFPAQRAASVDPMQAFRSE